MGKALTWGRGGEPLTPDDIAEIIVFAASRRENVVVAETLVFPSHQVCVCLMTSAILLLRTLGFYNTCASKVVARRLPHNEYVLDLLSMQRRG